VRRSVMSLITAAALVSSAWLAPSAEAAAPTAVPIAQAAFSSAAAAALTCNADWKVAS
jgi:hypothetical protein